MAGLDFREGKRLTVNGFKFNVLDHGQGEPVLLLHGFPDRASMWQKQIEALVGAGYRAIAPDSLGQGESELVQEVEPYRIKESYLDLLTGILDQLGVAGKVTVVGHDWGAATAWCFAALRPERTVRLMALSVGHPAIFFASEGGGLPQKMRSWYMLFFQHKGIAEEALANNTIFPPSPPPVSEYNVGFAADLARPGAATAALNWYRANADVKGFSTGALIDGIPSVSVPTLALWADGDDPFLTESSVKGSEALAPPGKFRYVHIANSSHWMSRDHPERINELLLGFQKEAA